MRGRGSDEEFYGQCMANARVLDEAAHRRAAAGDAVGALATCWGADIYAAQGVLWERILGAAAATQRQLYRAADALFQGLRAEAGAHTSGVDDTCADVVRVARARLLAECDDALTAAIATAWTDVDYLAVLPAPTRSDIETAVSVRLEGLSPAAFVARRRQSATDAMSESRSLRVRGDSAGALQAAYDADFLGFEAYLVESAIAAGDTSLQSVMVRWELATAAIAALPGLPSGFAPGVAQIRRSLTSGLARADAARLLASLPTIA